MNRLDIVAPFAVIVVLLIAVVAVFLRQGRNRVLEEIVAKGEVGPIASFRGTLAIRENRLGLLRLSKDSKARRLQFLYRWVIGIGPQAMVDEVTFDASQRSVELARNAKRKSVPFIEFQAIRLREVARKYGSVWHVELVAAKGSCILFLSSEQGDRRGAFERTAAVAKAVSSIMSLPVQVVVDGKAWTHGWPPKTRQIA